MAEGLHQRVLRERKAALPPESTWEDLALFRAYFRGRQKGTTSAAQRKILTSVVGNLFCDNVCGIIVGAYAGRVTLSGWTVEQKAVQEYLDDLWVRNALPDLSADTHAATIRDGNHAISLRWHAPNPDSPAHGRVTLHRERWWDGKEGVFVAYERDGTASYAVRDWKEFDPDTDQMLERRIVWFADRIERYAKRGDGWVPFDLPGKPESSAEAWVRSDGRPLGIPVIHFPKNSDDDGPYGASELDGGVIGMQDQVNDAQMSITAAGRLTGYQMYVSKGAAPKKNADGTDKALVVGPGMVFQDASADFDFNAVPAGDLSQLRTAYSVKLEAVCHMTDTPLHLITGQWPSGEALLRAEMPLVTKAQRLIKLLSPAWATVAHRATEMANTFGNAGLDEDASSAAIAATFEPADKRDALSAATVLIHEATRARAVEQLKTTWGLRAAGVPEDDIAALQAEMKSRAEEARQMFDSGEPDGLEDTADEAV